MSQSVQQIPIVSGAGGGQTPLVPATQVVNTFAELPAFGGVIGQYWQVDTATGSRFLFNYKASGIYKAESGGWRYIGDFQLLMTDDQFILEDNADNTKRLQFLLDNITTGNLRVVTIQDSNGTLAYLTDVPPVASQAETDAGTEDAKYVSPLTLHLKRSFQSFFLSAQGAFGSGGGWADKGFISNLPVLLFHQSNTERAIYMFYALERFLFDEVDPLIGFTVYSDGAPAGGADAVRWQLTAKYIGVSEGPADTADEVILQTQTLTEQTAETRQETLFFTLDRTLITNQDVMFFTLERIGGDAADNYSGDVAVSQSGLSVELTVDAP